MAHKDTNDGASAQGEPLFTEAQLNERVVKARAEEKAQVLARVTATLALSSAAIEPELLTAISNDVGPEKFAYTQALAAKAANATKGDAEAKARADYLASQKANEETIAATGLQLPTSKGTEDKPDVRADKKNRLLAGMARAGVLKPTATA